MIRSPRLFLMIPLGVLFSLMLLAYRAGFISVSADEFAKTVIASRGLSEPRVWFDPTNIWMPLHLILIAGASLITNDLLLASRVVSITFGVLLLISLSRIGRQSGGSFGAGIAAILGASHPLVVLLSATAMVDICYTSMFMLGLSFYLRFARDSRDSAINLFAACGCFTIACAFHYNAWVAVLPLAPFLLRDFYYSCLPPRILVLSLLVLGSAPLAWIAWSWMQSGHLLAFFDQHKAFRRRFLGLSRLVPVT